MKMVRRATQQRAQRRGLWPRRLFYHAGAATALAIVRAIALLAGVG